ncbi:MAG: hypothetical protein ACOYX1_17220 [Acidobacteriota bacterium]
MTGWNGALPAASPFDWAPASLATGNRKASAEAIHAAAAEFESLLVGQMLRAMREAGGGGWLGGDERDASFSLMEMAEQCLATALAAQGGLGLARLAEQSLAGQVSKPAGSAVETPPEPNAAKPGPSG